MPSGPTVAEVQCLSYYTYEKMNMHRAPTFHHANDHMFQRRLALHNRSLGRNLSLDRLYVRHIRRARAERFCIRQIPCLVLPENTHVLSIECPCADGCVLGRGQYKPVFGNEIHARDGLEMSLPNDIQDAQRLIVGTPFFDAEFFHVKNLRGCVVKR